MRMIAIGLSMITLGGCASYVPVETQRLAVPKECKARHAADLDEIPPMTGPRVSPDDVNRHWAAAWRLKSRPAYRRLYRNYTVCARYARGA